MEKRHLEGGVDRIINVLAPLIHSGKPAIAVRLQSEQEQIEGTCWHIQILGPSYIAYMPEEPVPGTDGRGVYALRTQAPLVLFCDEETTQ